MDLSKMLGELARTHGLPARTMLYPLQPYGRGTGDVESLVGYLGRLAQAHRVTPYSLHRRFLCWVAIGQLGAAKKGLLYRPGFDGPDIRFSNFDREGHLGRALEIATGIPDLTELSLHTLHGAFTTDKGGVRKHVCPHCVKEAAYERLVWQLPGVDACDRHNCALQLPPTSDQDFHHHRCDLDDAALITARDAREILAHRKNFSWAPEFVTLKVKELSKHYGVQGSRVLKSAGCRRFKALLAIPESKARWDLKDACAVARLFQLSLKQLLSGEIGAPPLIPIPPPTRQQKFREALQAHSGKMSVQAVCIKLRVGAIVLRKLLPDECKDFEEAWRREEELSTQRIQIALQSHNDPTEPLSAVVERHGTNFHLVRTLFPAECRRIERQFAEHIRQVRVDDTRGDFAKVKALFEAGRSREEIRVESGIGISQVDEHLRSIRRQNNNKLRKRLHNLIAAGKTKFELAEALGRSVWWVEAAKRKWRQELESPAPG